MICMKWANQYSKYIKGDDIKLVSIDNNQLKNKQKDLDCRLVEDEDYVIFQNYIKIL